MIVKHVKTDKHTEYMGCAQYIDWIVKAFGNDLCNAFIVQEISLVIIIDEAKTVTRYFEAWHVAHGECNNALYQDSHDLFCIGHPLDDGDAIAMSVGHKGRVSFIPRVFYVKEGCALFDEIQSWPTDEVKEANGLQAKYYTEEIAKQVYKCPEFFREPFYHEWEFDDPEKIYAVVLQYCINMYRRDNIGRNNIEIALDDFFPNGVYPDIKKRVIETWENH